MSKIDVKDLVGMAGVTHHMGVPSVIGRADLGKFVSCLFKHYKMEDKAETTKDRVFDKFWEDVILKQYPSLEEMGLDGEVVKRIARLSWEESFDNKGLTRG